MKKNLCSKSSALRLIMVLTMVLIMVFAMLSPSAFAADGSNVQVDITSQAAGGYLHAPASAVTVNSGLAESYGYTDSIADGVSALDVLVKAQELVLGEAFTKETAKDCLVVGSGGFVSTLFGEKTAANGFFLNGASPNDGTESSFGGYNGTTVTTQKVVTGDALEFFIYQDTVSYGDRYCWFTQKDGVVPNLIGLAGQPLDLVLQGVPAMNGYLYLDAAALQKAGTGIKDAQLAWVDEATGALTDLANTITAENGKVTLTLPAQAGNYELTAYLPQTAITGGGAPIFMPLQKVTVMSSLSNLAFAKDGAGLHRYTLNPDFHAAATEYSMTLPDDISAFYVFGTPTVQEQKMILHYPNSWGGTSRISPNAGTWHKADFMGVGAEGKTFRLQVGPATANGFSIDPAFATEYSIVANRQLSLSALRLNDTLSPAFDNDILNYTAVIPENAATVGITAIGYQPNYTVTCGTIAATGDTPTELTLVWDAQNKMEVPIVVSFEGGVTTTYTITLTKEIPVAIPSFSVQPTSTIYLDTAKAAPLTARAVATGALTYQWYSNTADSNQGGTPIPQATETSYTPQILDVGKTQQTLSYYYCVATNTVTKDTTASQVATITVKPDPTPTVSYLQADGTAIPAAGYGYNTGDAATAFQAICNSDAEGGTYTYEWYQKYEYGSGSAAGVRNQASYTPPTNRDGRSNYFCRVTYTCDGVAYNVNENADLIETTIPVQVTATGAAAPTITTQPVGAEYAVGTTSLTPLSVVGKTTDGGRITYQWCRSTDGTTYTPIADATASSYQPAGAAEPGTIRYYCKVTNTIKSSNGNTYLGITTSDPAMLTYKSLAELGATWTGSGTAAAPFQINDLTDLQLLQSLVNTNGVPFENTCFLLTKDIALPAAWVPIGALKPGATASATGKNIYPFSGVFDGGGHKITVATEGLPLFGYVREAKVCNLNLYGEKIAGYGLVNNYCVDYGADGSYYSGTGGSWEPGCPDIIEIDHVTLLSGSSTQKSGLLGGFASAANIVTISNSTVEANVIIGYTKDMTKIGSFAGDLNGVLKNCTSQATVYGKDYVGGLVGSKGEAMGPCKVLNSAFLGTVEASGNQAGGIIGAGYSSSSAPNSPCITVQNCYVTGSITGADSLGGITGGEPAIKNCYPNGPGYIQNNHFNGTLHPTDPQAKYVGGIIGYMCSLNPYNIVSNNHYLEGCGATVGLGGVGTVQPNREDDPTGAGAAKLTTAAKATAFQDGSLVALLNEGENSYKNWVQGTNGPVFSAEPVLTTLLLSGTYKTEYKLGEKLDTKGMIITATYSDSTTKILTPAEVTFTGFSSNTKGVKPIKVTYNGGQTSYTVRVLAPETSSDITVYLALYGDTAHGEITKPHTLKNGGLTPWLAKKAYKVSINATVKDVMTQAMTAAGLTWSNPTGNYIESITHQDVTLGEFTNGKLSGWMYTINGTHSELGIKEQYLNAGDVIVWHYSDDYTKERGSDGWGGGGGTTEPVLPVPPVTPPASTGFLDVATTDWFYNAVQFVTTNKLLLGTRVDQFSPNDNMTRAMLWTVLYRQAGSPAKTDNTLWYGDAQKWVVANQISDGTNPAGNVTREELATTFYRYAKTMGTAPTGSWAIKLNYADTAQFSDWAIDGAMFSQLKSLITGKPGNLFDPQGTATRAEVATVLQRFASLNSK